MSRDPVIPQWAIDRLARRHHREHQRKAAFIRSTARPATPPHAWHLSGKHTATCGASGGARRSGSSLRRTLRTTPCFLAPWTRQSTQHSRSFMRDVGTLAEGEYARSLPKKEMLTTARRRGCRTWRWHPQVSGRWEARSAAWRARLPMRERDKADGRGVPEADTKRQWR